MSRPDDDDPAEHLKQGIGHFWRAARGVASGLKREVDKTGWSRTLDDAGRELVRAATNVVTRIGTEVTKVAPREDEPPAQARGGDPPRPEEPPPWHQSPDLGAKPKGPTPEDPGFRIADDPSKDEEPQ
jgi:hypothetical protein